MSYAKPQLTTRVSNDLENSASATLSETVQQYLVGGGIDWYVGSHRSGARVWPFIGGGAAYLRQLHEGATLVATGQSYDIGGGVKLLLASRTRPRQLMRAAGVRLDARLVVRTKGITFDGHRTVVPAAAASLFVGSNPRVQRGVVRRHDVVVCVADRFPVVDRGFGPPTVDARITVDDIGLTNVRDRVTSDRRLMTHIASNRACIITHAHPLCGRRAAACAVASFPVRKYSIGDVGFALRAAHRLAGCAAVR